MKKGDCTRKLWWHRRNGYLLPMQYHKTLFPAVHFPQKVFISLVLHSAPMHDTSLQKEDRLKEVDQSVANPHASSWQQVRNYTASGNLI